MGSSCPASALRSELYDPASESWGSPAPGIAKRYNFSATKLPNGKVLVAGGSFSGTLLATTAIYDPATNSWSSGALMGMPRFPDGRVLVFGGFSAPNALSSAEI